MRPPHRYSCKALASISGIVTTKGAVNISVGNKRPLYRCSKPLGHPARPLVPAGWELNRNLLLCGNSASLPIHHLFKNHHFFSFVISSHAMRGASFKRSFDKKALRVIVVGRTRIDRLSRVGEVSWKRTCSLSRRENRNRFLADHWDRNTDTTMATGKSSVHSKKPLLSQFRLLSAATKLNRTQVELPTWSPLVRRIHSLICTL